MPSPSATHRLLAVLPLSLLCTSCAVALKMVGLEDPREAYVEDELPKVQGACRDGLARAAAYRAASPEQRSVAGPGASLTAAQDALRACRNQVERLATAALTDASGEKTIVVPDPDSVTLELDGARVSLPSAYRRAYQLESELRALPLDLCPERRGNISQKGFAGSWEPLQVSLSGWRGADCSNSPHADYVTATLPPDTLKQLRGECPAARINVPDFELEGLGPNLARRWTTVVCEQPRRRADGSAALDVPTVGNCEPCRVWVTDSR